MVGTLSSFGGGTCTGFQGMGLQYAGAGYKFPLAHPETFKKYTITKKEYLHYKLYSASSNNNHLD